MTPFVTAIYSAATKESDKTSVSTFVDKQTLAKLDAIAEMSKLNNRSKVLKVMIETCIAEFELAIKGQDTEHKYNVLIEDLLEK